MTRAGLIVLLCSTATSCLDRAAVLCADGRVCPAGTVCVESVDRCVDPDRVAVCAEAGDGADCSAAGIAIGVCAGGVCMPAGCGNEIVDGDEVCDDGNTVAGDGCAADCLSDETCGNAVVDRDEECDEGEENSLQGGRCRLDCRFHCGDGVVAADELCDPGSGLRPSCLSLFDEAGHTFERGLTTCDDECKPALNSDTCKYFGWRTRDETFDWVDTAIVEPGGGFGVVRAGSGGRAALFSDVTAPTPGSPEIFDSPSAELTAVWADSKVLAVVVGAGGTIARWDGAAWTTESSGTTETLRDVWGRDGDDIYAVGDGGTVLHYTAGFWSPVPFPVATTLRGVAGSAAALYTVGDGGTFYRRVGGAWTDVGPGTSADLRGVWSDGSLVVAVGDSGAIVELRGDAVSAGRSLITTDLYAVWGSSQEGFFAAGEHGVLAAFDGAIWRLLSLGTGVSGPDVQNFSTVAGAAGQQAVLAAGDGGAISFEGASWSPTPSPTVSTLLALSGTAVDNVFAVGRDGTILHHDGLSWEVQASGTNVDLHGVWAVSPALAFAVGEDGIALRYDGAWAPVDVGVTGPLWSVWASADDDVYIAAGDAGLLHFDGIEWATVDLPAPPAPATPPAVTLVWGTGIPGDVFALGSEGYHLDAGEWVYERWFCATSIAATEVPGGWLSLCGTSSVVAWDGAVLNNLPFNRPAGATAIAYDVDSRRVLIGGEGGTLWVGPPNFSAPFEQMRARRSNDITAVLLIDDVLFLAGTDGALDTLYFQR